MRAALRCLRRMARRSHGGLMVRSDNAAYCIPPPERERSIAERSEGDRERVDSGPMTTTDHRQRGWKREETMRSINVAALAIAIAGAMCFSGTASAEDTAAYPS